MVTLALALSSRPRRLPKSTLFSRLHFWIVFIRACTISTTLPADVKMPRSASSAKVRPPCAEVAVCFSRLSAKPAGTQEPAKPAAAKPVAKAPDAVSRAAPSLATKAVPLKRRKSPAKKSLVDSESESDGAASPAKDTDAASTAAATAPTQTLGGRRRSASVAKSYAEDSGSSGDSDDSDVKPEELKARKQPRKKLKRAIAENSDDSDR